MQQPISVRTVGDRFVLTSGLRRITAARMLSWQTIPAIVRSVTANDAYLLDMIENLQREDLTPEEEAQAFRELIQALASIAKAVGYRQRGLISAVGKMNAPPYPHS